MKSSLCKALIGIAFTATIVAIIPRAAQGQKCLGSRVAYLVRDEKGRPIDETVKDLWQVKDNGSGSSRGWSAPWSNFSKDDSEQVKVLPASIATLQRKIVTFNTAAYCSFDRIVKLQLKHNGKVMNLIFNTASADDQWYMVDALPFQEGSFEIQLPKLPPRSWKFFASRDWKKSTGATESASAKWEEVKPDIPPPGSLRAISGQVVDAATGKPIPGAKVYLKFKGSYMEGRGVADAKGAFMIDELRSDRIGKIMGLAVAAYHPDYDDAYVVVFEDESGKLLESASGVVIKLLHYLTVSGRVIDETTGAVPPGADKFYLSFQYGQPRRLWNDQISGASSNTYVKPDGTFTIKTRPGGNRVYFSDEADHYGGYTLLPENFQKIDIGEAGVTNLVLKVKKQKP